MRERERETDRGVVERGVRGCPSISEQTNGQKDKQKCSCATCQPPLGWTTQAATPGTVSHL